MSDKTVDISLSYFALLREQRGLAHERIATTATTARDLYAELAARYSFTLPIEKMGVAVNDRFGAIDHQLKNGDDIAFIPPVAGG